jgi:16S rRNA (guanine527-N7)-methyltransferase
MKVQVNNMIQDIIAKIKKLKYIDLTDEKIASLEQFYQLLIQENEIHNLTRIVEHRDVWAKHFYDSLLICDEMDLSGKKICDVGTGPGIPGIVLKICFPDIKLTLIESNAKKTSFLEKAVYELKLSNVWIVTERAEKYSKTFKETQDIIISRAVAALNVLLEIAVQALKVNGHFICLKSQKLDEELADLNGQEQQLGLQFVSIQHFDEEIIGVRNNIIYQKVKPTSNTYPRMYAQIKNRPLGK